MLHVRQPVRTVAPPTGTHCTYLPTYVTLALTSHYVTQST
jgi:hypothetical protein